MKRLLSATLALTLLGATAASADSYGRGGYDRGYGHGGHNNTGALIGLGIGLFALGAIAASQHNDRDRYDDRGYQGNYGGYQNSGYQGRDGYQTNYRNDYRGSYQNYRGNGYSYGDGNGYGNNYGNGYGYR
ncbi:MAG TPA: hypothetical protein VNY75_06685 [Rhizomicrobium sp.]|nr:hypothetical protein [Rhizomicrobium sp.]